MLAFINSLPQKPKYLKDKCLKARKSMGLKGVVKFCYVYISLFWIIRKPEIHILKIYFKCF
jgi:hypothetical protein